MPEVRCECGVLLRLGPEWAGRQGRCPRCQAVLQIPESTATPGPENTASEMSWPDAGTAGAEQRDWEFEPPPIVADETPPEPPPAKTPPAKAQPAKTPPPKAPPAKGQPAKTPPPKGPPSRPTVAPSTLESPPIVSSALVSRLFRSRKLAVATASLTLTTAVAVVVWWPTQDPPAVAETPSEATTSPVAPVEAPPESPLPAARPATEPAAGPPRVEKGPDKESPDQENADKVSPDKEVSGNAGPAATGVVPSAAATKKDSPSGGGSPAELAKKNPSGVEPNRELPPGSPRPSSKTAGAKGLSGATRQYDDPHCVRIQQQFAIRVPSATNILEVDGELLPLASGAPVAECRAPFLFLPKGEHLVRFRLGERSVRVSIAESFVVTQREMRQFFRADRENALLTDELLERSARAMDVHGAPFLLNLLGASYAQQGKWEAAERKFRRALAVNVSYSPAHLNLVVCLLRREDREGAEVELRLAEAFNIQNVFGLATAIHELRAQHGLEISSSDPLPLELSRYESSEQTTVEDERVVAILQGLSRYAVRVEDRGKILSNLGLHFAETGRVELGLRYFRDSLDAFRRAGPERFALASHVLTLMEQACRRSQFDEADEYAFMKKAVSP